MGDATSVYHKYRGDSPFTESILTDRKVFLATAHQLNDPFECSIADLSRDWINEQVEQATQAGLAGFVMEAGRTLRSGEPFFKATRGEVQLILDAIRAAETLEAKDAIRIRFMLEQTGHAPTDVRPLFGRLDAQLVEIGIFSLSRDPVQPLMWAHYANQHHGLCFGFRAAPGSKLSDPNHCLPVHYSDALPHMDDRGLRTVTAFSADAHGRLYPSSLKIAFEDTTLQRVISTKSTHWTYEAEVRYVEPFGGLFDWPGELAECTFGWRCHDDRRRHYIELLESHVPNAVSLFEIRPVAGTNAFERVPLDPSATQSRAAPRAVQERNETGALPIEEFIKRMERLMQEERYGEVIYQTGQNLKRSPDAAIFLHIKANAHGMAQEHEEAREIFDNLSKTYPDNGQVWYGLACSLEALGRMSEVVPALRRAAELDNKDASIALNLGVHLARDLETQAEAVEYLRKAQRLGHRRAARIIAEVQRDASSK
ncbi:Tetratricopeptide repeat-containing protein [Sphingomonas guangdongensis]|uniref:Tetratricopeptide repeat-containing protein n=1 Tax=Sphingomonas guangdongensis TaxID=1141890 RepID=A0A285QC82_9SPHN|nr:DUF2971 domain-containing protein [Sphingomonas guangdongensis]SOB79128.1 Tetratricopeptide repeat-containing protein [Sphingomonas guangdongensis]